MCSLKRTPLYSLHAEYGAKFVPFAGYEMPVQYALGVKREHEHTRAACGLFDVSHMGQVLLRGRDAAQSLEALAPGDFIDLEQGAQRYSFFTNPEGGLYDDFMTVNAGDHLYLVVNAACKDQDIALLRIGLDPSVDVVALDDRALLALQGPQAQAVMERICPEANRLLFMQHARFDVEGETLWISRSGYTGEDGFEISLPAAYAEAFARRLLGEPEVELVGLGARDSLRLEAGLCLYGHDIDEHTDPVSASLVWALAKCRRQGGEREGGFPGADVILPRLAARDELERRVGLLGEGRAPIREGTTLFDGEGREVGRVTSGTFGPTVGQPVAMGYVRAQAAALGTKLYAEVRGKRLPMEVVKLPFVPARYHRG
ncbi:glycine cleavage system aminomethyltransferase GcvT [Halotalea alkalilenta]|uniref:aminomethyltransferase n=1 Tax=Halotalea alkalilenta TaxID=376489 RepID=A0A172YG57_9GAMM|nr:glycine cleavage system aminomethyltransferase GcvT [Halotalea alkalilenta]ANF58261.1 glycine cleavage system protein T [Halotalea alkalilenta]